MAAGILGRHVVPVLEQTLPADHKEGGAGDLEASAKGEGGEPDQVVPRGIGWLVKRICYRMEMGRQIRCIQSVNQ